MKEDLIKKIIETEWKQFDAVQNQGGRASCQDDHVTFEIMRKSQFLVWPDEALESYYDDICKAEENHWNLITEKYARMMERTDPEQYATLKDKLPQLSEARLKDQDEIVEIEVQWMENFAFHYPLMAGNSRSIRKDTDSRYNTSYETYLLGELCTYSDKTFKLYQQFILEKKEKNENIVWTINENTAKLYGYKSLKDAEDTLSR